MRASHLRRPPSKLTRTVSVDTSRTRQDQLPKNTKMTGLAQTAQKINEELKLSSFPMRQMRCEVEGNTLLIKGRAATYYLIQLALELALRHAGTSRIVMQVEVMSYLFPTDDYRPVNDAAHPPTD